MDNLANFSLLNALGVTWPTSLYSLYYSQLLSYFEDNGLYVATHSPYLLFNNSQSVHVHEHSVTYELLHAVGAPQTEVKTLLAGSTTTTM